MPPRVALLAALMAPFVPVVARAEPVERGALRLDWSAPGGCPNSVEVVERIEALLGARVADLRAEPVVATGKVTEIEPLRYELELETHQREQRFVRSMQAPSCTELADAGALVLALSIDPTLAERQAHAAAAEKPPETSALPSEPPPLPPAKPAPVLPTSVRAPEPALPRDEEPSVRAARPHDVPEWSARAGLVLDLGTVADVAFGPRAAVTAGFGALRVDLGLVWLPPARSITAQDPERGGDIDLVAAELGACFLPFRGALEAEGCASAEIGRLHGAGFGTATETEGSALWLGAGASALGRVRAAEALSVVASAGFLATPEDTEFTLENVGLVHRIPRVVGRFGVAVETEFE